MTSISLADAKAQLSALVERAVQGEAIDITRRGTAIARITTLDRPRKRIDAAALRRLTDAMPAQAEPAGDWMRGMRDDSRY